MPPHKHVLDKCYVYTFGGSAVMCTKHSKSVLDVCLTVELPVSISHCFSFMYNFRSLLNLPLIVFLIFFELRKKWPNIVG